MAFDLPLPQPSIEIAVASRGYSKGTAQTTGPQLVVRPELAFGGLRVGAYGKNVTSPDFEAEGGALVGVRRSFGKTEVSGMAAVKRLFDTSPDVDRTALELAGSVSRAFGRLKPFASLTFSPDELGTTKRSGYWEAGSAYQIDGKTGASIGVGLRKRSGGPDYTSFNAGFTRSLFGPFAADIRLHGTNRSRLGDVFKERVVVSLRTKL
jgi:hypothetical protein